MGATFGVDEHPGGLRQPLGESVYEKKIVWIFGRSTLFRCLVIVGAVLIQAATVSGRGQTPSTPDSGAGDSPSFDSIYRQLVAPPR
jgi:hypothetical protein